MAHRRLEIHPTYGKLGQPAIGLFVFLKSLAQKVGNIHQPQLASMSTRSSIGGKLVMLHSLNGANQRHIQQVRLNTALEHSLTFFDKTLHTKTLSIDWLDIQLPEDLFDALCMLASFFKVSFQSDTQIIRLHSLSQFRQNSYDLIFGVIDVL